jgi:Flp pilus assembly protein TadD
LYGDAVPLGPLMELGKSDADTTLTAERAAQSVDYWRTTAQSILADPAATASDYTLKSYSHNADSTANLLAARHYYSEAEQAYRLSSQLWPGNPDAAGGLATILARTGRADQARQVLDAFASKYPDQRSAIETFRGTITWMPPSPAN